MRGLMLCAATTVMFAASGAMAADEADLGCMAQSYTTDQLSDIDALLPQVDLLTGEASPAMDALGGVIAAAVLDCAQTRGWQESQFEGAVLYEFGRMAELGIRQHGPLGAADIAKVESALAKGDRTALWNALENQVASGVSGDTGTVNPDAALVLGAFMMETGVSLDGNMPELVGAFLATKAMQRISARAFSAQ